MSELVQAPIEVLELNGHRSLVLADADITDLQWSGGALWHVGMAGAGFQVAGSGTPALWYVPEGELLDAHAIVNGTGWFGHPQGLHVMRADLPSEGATRIGEDHVHALSADDVGAVVVEGNLTDLHVAHYGARDSGEGAEPVYRHPMGVNVPDPLLNMVLEAEVNGSHILHAEGLFGWQAHRVQVDATGVEVWGLEGQSPPSPRGPRNQSAAEGPECDGDTGVVDGLNSTLAWCTGGDRLIGWNLENGDVVEMRLPKAAEIDGLGRVPVLFLAASGDDGLEVSDDEVVLSGAFDLLNLTDADEVWVAGAVPWAWGDSQRSRLNVSASSTNVNLTGVEELEQLILGVVHPDTAVRLAGASEGDRSMVVIQSSELSYDALLRAVEAWYDDMATLESSGLGLSPVRVEAAEQAEASSGVLSGMFLVFGGFTIAAGVLLAVTVVVLLAEARRKELATLRAVGLTRADARSAALDGGAHGRFLGRCSGRSARRGPRSRCCTRFHLCLQRRWGHHLHLRMVMDICGRGGRLGDGRCCDDSRCIGTMVQPLGRPSRASWVRTRVQEALPWPVFVAVAAAFGLSGVAAVSLIFGAWTRLRSPALAVDWRRADRRFVLDSPVDRSRFAFIDGPQSEAGCGLRLHVRRRCVARPARVVMVAGVARHDSGSVGLRRGQHARAGFGSGAGGRHRLGDGDPSRASCTRGSWPQPTAGGPLGPCPSCRTTLAHGGGDVHVRRDGVRCGRPWRLHQFLRCCFWGFC